MDTISRQNNDTRTPRGLRSLIMLVYVLLLTVVLVLVNIYPMRIMENKIVDSARVDMIDDSATLASALGNISTLSVDNISSAISVLNLMRDNRRIVATDSGGVVIYDRKQNSGLNGQMVFFAEVLTALEGQDVFYCVYEGEAFDKWSASPIMNGTQLLGSVYIYEKDSNSALLLKDIAYNLRMVSAGAIVLSLCCILLFNKVLGKRFSKLLVGVREARSGNFNYRIKMSGNDELARIASEFNDLSARIQTNEMARRRFVSDASHELKTPLASIKLLSDSISQNKNISRETVNEFLGDISGEIVRLIRISEELIAINKVDAVTDEKYACDVYDTVQKAVERLQVNAQVAKVRLYAEAEEGCTVFATDDGIYHIVFNLIENAIKYNREGGKVRVRLSKRGGKVILSVLDTGIGIPEHDQKRVFERFFRVDKNRSRATGGTGLGLSIVKEWTDKFDGRISLESYYGEGSEFTVEFPYYDGEEEAES